MMRIFTFVALVLFISYSEIYAGTYSGGAGTVGNPYQISTTADLIELSKTSADWASHFILTQDIAFNANEQLVDWDGDGSATWDAEDQLGFSPIGNWGIRFTGTFDGQSFEIDNLFINRPTHDFVGLFGIIGGASVRIKNLGLTNVVVTGNDYVGGLVGINDGTISNCYSTGSVSGNYYVGGLVGYNASGTVSNCYSTGSVSGTYSIGGLVGNNYYGLVSNCYSTGDVGESYSGGGLVGINDGTISYCYSTGSVSGSDNIGGLVGINYGTISNCSSTGSVSGTNYIGGLVGYNYHGLVSNCYSTGDVGESYFCGGLVGMNTGTISNCFSTGSVSGSDNVGGLVGWNEATISNCSSTGSVSGNFEVGGLVGINDGTISYCYSTGSVSGLDNIGGFAGWNVRTISNCYSSGSVNGYNGLGGLVGYNYKGLISNSYSTGSVSESIFSGGLVGNNGGTISNSFWDTETSYLDYSDGGTDKSTTEMKDIATFTDESTDGLDLAWDFVGNPNDDIANDDIWNIYPLINNGYPYFDWQIPCKDEVWVSNNYNSNTSGWEVTHFDNIGDAIFFSCDDATVNISNYSHTGNVDMTGYTFIIGDDDFDLDGVLSGGLIQTPSTGALILPAVQNVQKDYPMGDGTNNYTLKIIPLNAPTNPIIVRLYEQSVPGAVKAPMPFWEIEGDDDLDATIVFRIDKSAIAPKKLNTNSILRFFDGDKYVPVTEEQVAINDKGSYYEIIIINVNKF